MKEIYPRLPTAPPIEDQGHGYRLQKINGWLYWGLTPL